MWNYGLVIFSPFLLAQQLVFINQRSLNCVALTPPLSTPVPLDNCKPNPPLVGPRLFPGKPTHRAVTTVCSNDLVVVEDQLLD